jgi:hypothetical protein
VQVNSRGRLAALTAGILIIVALTIPGVSAADTGVTIEPAFSQGATVNVASVTFQTKLLVNVALDVSCDPFVERGWDGQPTGNTTTAGSLGGSVQLLQAQGRSIAHGYGSIGQFNVGSPVTCDGSTFRVVVAVVAQDLPLKRGDALVGAYIGASASVPCCSNWTFDSASSGAVAVRIR